MFFFLAGGVGQQVRQVIRYGAGNCVACGSKADLVEYDKVLKLFFVPVWKWPSKYPLMHCDTCDLFFPPPPPPPPNDDHAAPPYSAVPLSLRCRSCDRLLRPDFRFCPFCGASL